MTPFFWQGFVVEWWQASFLSQGVRQLRLWGQASWIIQGLDPLAVLLFTVYLGFSSQATTPSLGLILLGMAAITVIYALFRGVQITGIHGILGLFWGIATLSTLFSPAGSVAQEGWIKLTLYLLGFTLLHQILQRYQYRSWLITILLLVSLGMGVYGIRQYFYGAEELATWVDPESGLSGTTRVYSSLLNPNLYGGFLVPVLPFCLAAWVYWRSWGVRLVWGLTTGINLLCLLLTYSRGAWVGGVVALSFASVFMLVWLQDFVPRRWRRWTLPAFGGGSLLVLLFGILTLPPLRLRILSIFAGRQDSSNNFRINVWQACFKMLKDFPGLGIGPGNDAFNRVYPLYQISDYSALGAYSVPLEIALETGVVGGIGYICFVIAVVRWGWQQWRRLLQERDPQSLWVGAALAAVLGMMAHGLVDTVWYRPQIQMLWWFAVAILTSTGRQAPPFPLKDTDARC
jgi:putative inorganic carbon (HCO3(-)) transporter